jgi:hypothetical protein
MNLYEKIQAVSMEVMNVEKDMTVGQGQSAYKAVSDNQVTLAVKRAEEKFKIISIPIKQECISHEVVKTLNPKGEEKLTYVDNIKMTVKIIDLEKPEDFIEIESLGKGVDSYDKGFGKASTYARKYALLNAYKIATGEDPDAEKSKELTTVEISEKKATVIAYCEKNQAAKDNILSHFNLGKLDDLSKTQIDTVYSQFKTKKLI